METEQKPNRETNAEEIGAEGESGSGEWTPVVDYGGTRFREIDTAVSTQKTAGNFQSQQSSHEEPENCTFDQRHSGGERARSGDRMEVSP